MIKIKLITWNNYWCNARWS